MKKVVFLCVAVFFGVASRVAYYYHGDMIGQLCTLIAGILSIVFLFLFAKGALKT